MSLYDFYMYLKHIEHSPENLEFYVWYAVPHTGETRLETDLIRFKNFEAGRLTSLSEVHREQPTIEDQTSEYSSEIDLSKPDKDDNSPGGASVTEIHNDFGLEGNGQISSLSRQAYF
jgi:hypothetical protein